MWGSWQGFSQPLNLTHDTLRELLDGGQSFRWRTVPGDSCWQGVFGHNLVQVRLEGNREVEFRIREGYGSVREVEAYFAINFDWAACQDALPWRSDPHLENCMKAFPGLRILRQPFGETLFSFICSTARQIVQIKQCCETVAERFGESLGCGTHAWPDWKVLSEIPEKELRACKLGYRARYISETATILTADSGFEKKLLASPVRDAKSMLMSLPGVGAKVADCVLLFGAGKLEVFPVDTWIKKSISRVYGQGDWNPIGMARFGRIHFGKAAGLAQQFLFAWERSQP